MNQEEFNRLNWVERKSAIERMLADGKPEMWHAVRAALQDACASFKKHYGRLASDIECKLENGSRLLVTRKNGTGDTTRDDMLVEFDEDHGLIKAAASRGVLEFRIHCDENGSGLYLFSLMDKKPLTPDQVSQRILEPLFFPPRPR